MKAREIEKMTKEEELSKFDQIIESIGNSGFFQTRFFWTFNFILVCTASMPYMSILISLNTPEHWCHVPGRKHTNYTVEEWKNLTIPWEINNEGVYKYSQCKRYANISLDGTSGTTVSSLKSNKKSNIIKCDSGWEYDHTWYDLTVTMQNNWVCDDAMIPTNTLALVRVGEVVGSLIFGQLADSYGRMPVFYACVVVVLVGKIMSILTSSYWYLFLLFSFIGGLPSTSIYQGPLIIAMEISRADQRAWIGMIQNYGWNLGVLVIPLIMWWLRDWKSFTLISTLPCALFLFSRPWIIESPRWLASRGKVKHCIRELNKIARTNKRPMPDYVEAQLRKIGGPEKVYTAFSLFSSPRLAKNTILLIYSWTIMMIIYMCLSMNVTNMDGNPFMNYLYQGLAEIPAYIIGKWICDRYGRRWTNFIGFVFTFFGCIPVFFFVHDSSNAWIVNCLCVFMKFNVAMAFFCISVQCMEIFPTCVRQTGVSVAIIFGNIFGILTPYIIALGVSVNPVLPYLIYAISAILAALAMLFLPETYIHQLPETLEDAAKFGKNQDLWGREKPQKYTDVPLDSKTVDEYTYQHQHENV